MYSNAAGFDLKTRHVQFCEIEDRVACIAYMFRMRSSNHGTND